MKQVEGQSRGLTLLYADSHSWKRQSFLETTVFLGRPLEISKLRCQPAKVEHYGFRSAEHCDQVKHEQGTFKVLALFASLGGLA